MALGESKVFEVPLEFVTPQLEMAPQLLKLLVKNLFEKYKLAAGELRTIRFEKDSTPCPPENIPKVYATLFYLAKYTGKEVDGKVTVSWTPFKQYAQRVFLESPQRLENACNLLVKLKLAELKMVKSDEADKDSPEIPGFYTFHDLTLIERFFEFYQYHFYRGSAQKILKPDEKVMIFLEQLLKNTENERKDKTGITRVGLKEVMDKVKESLGSSNMDYFAWLEQKGLFAKRETTSTGVFVSFHRDEFANTLLSWRILKEVEKWNEKGFVDLNEKPPIEAKEAVATYACPSCQGSITDSMKFCPSCGTKVAKAA
jgi:rubrerythrin